VTVAIVRACSILVAPPVERSTSGVRENVGVNFLTL